MLRPSTRFVWLLAAWLGIGGCAGPTVPDEPGSQGRGPADGAAPRGAQAPGPSATPTGKPKVPWTVHTLANGMQLVVEEVHSRPAVAISLNVLTGSAGERPHEFAGAHFLEHMLYMGTPTRTKGQIRNEMHDRGAQTGAMTDYERIEYWVTCQPGDFALAVEGLADGFHNMVLDEAAFEAERTVIIDELQQRLDDNFVFCYEECARLTFQPHPYTRRKGGELDEAKRLSRDDIDSIRRDFYRPDNLVLIVSGDVDAAEVLRVATAHFGGDPRPAKPKAEVPRPDPARGFEHRFIERDSAQTYITIGAPMPSMVHPDQAAVDLMVQFVHARLYTQLVVQRKIASSLTGGVSNHRDLGFFQFTATAAGHEKAAEVERVMLEQLWAVAQVPNPPAAVGGWDEYAELAKFQQQFRMDQLFNQQDARARTGGIAWGACEGTLDHWANYLDRIDAVQLTDIGRTAKIYLDSANLNTVIVGPTAARLTAADEVERQKWIGHLAFGKAPPDTGAVAPTTVATGWVEQRLENGVRVLTKSSKDFPLVSFGIFTHGGAAHDPIGLEGRANLANALLTIGAGPVTQIDGTPGTALNRAGFSTRIYEFGNNFEKSTVRSHSRHVLTVAKTDLEKALNMMAAAYREPTFPEDEVAVERDQALGQLRTAADNITSVAMQHIRRLVYGARHPYAQELFGNATSLPLLTRADIQEAASDGMDPGRAVITFFGDITPREALTLARKSFGPWRVTAREGDAPPMEGVVPDFDPPAGGRHEFHIDKEQAFVVMGCQSVPYGSEHYAAASMLAKVGQVRAFKELIYERKTGYSASTWLDCSTHGGGFFLYVHCHPDKVDTAIAELQAMAHTLGNELIPDAELANAKANMIGGARLAKQRGMNIARDAGANAVLGLPADYDEQFLTEIANLTPAHIREAARTWFNPGTLTLVIVRRDANKK